MAGKRKLEHFAEMRTFPHVFEPTLEEVFRQPYKLIGNWRKTVFKNDNPIVLELGCGKGEYAVGMARKFPNKNFIGIDIKGARMWRGAKTSLEEGLTNVAFLRTRIEFIDSCFGADEVDEIWITFPDPQKKDRREKKRLTGPLFINRYRQFLKREGIVHLKTDSDFFYEYSLNEAKLNGYPILEQTNNLYAEKIEDFDIDTQEILSIKTHYEGIFTEKGHKIHYLKFRLHHD
ncbi:MAG: tRNA (guanosine(46)-N7)-methyltransferase TrmB [Bacteroidetes bacterium]|nr:MAG: tRNA (guanosine(46)-N7)-methyltransferase TrmB [Bacteroidota bacterium]MBL1143873.1 tRNA (guanosine(46)-N7)-methyltransferase TrmB [Bacteroidota bacterium]MCB0801517.1 tRNA (guanosine(46)-N7)-methyltransferase TrmB [Flavobacteriales bacterium]NOG56674.1 tRNA (guanosine(46)-N7)-methyltransferase TrmB [Bacteroidota bacterium]